MSMSTINGFDGNKRLGGNSSCMRLTPSSRQMHDNAKEVAIIRCTLSSMAALNLSTNDHETVRVIEVILWYFKVRLGAD